MKIARTCRLSYWPVNLHPAGRAALQRAVLVVLSLVLSACVSPSPPEPPLESPARTPEEVELTLNLPADKQDCACPEPSAEDRTFLERGIVRLTAGDYIEAVQAFKRYRRLEQTSVAQWEADLAIAYVSMLPRSPFYDVDAARDSYTALQSREPRGDKYYGVVLMQQALESFVLLDRHVNDLENRTSMLEDDLDKREQALKRLRELTLGQPEGGL
ncbi:MAG: hypothetical protein AAF098_06660 [Pseudomonadota bacterium]